MHVIPSLSPKHGGPSMALPAMARALVARGIQVDVATTDDDGPGCRLTDVSHGVPVQRDGFRVFYFPKQTEFYKVSLPLWGWLLKNISQYDVGHVHAVFSFSTLAAGWAASLRGVPFIVRPLGVLNSWGMANRRRWIKAWSFRLLDQPVLNRAAALHYTSTQERDDAARLRLRPRAEVIPLGFDFPAAESLPPAALFHAAFPQTRDVPLVLFLSRLDVKKNVELLLEAFALLHTDARLVIAGSGDANYAQSLRAMSARLGLAGRVIWTGHLDGDLKLSAYAAATIYVLPSHSENFGIALLEAMAAGLACVSTAGVALAAEAAAEGAVMLVEPTPDHLAAALDSLLLNPTRRKALGQQAATLARQRYSLDALCEALQRLYREIHSA